MKNAFWLAVILALGSCSNERVSSSAFNSMLQILLSHSVKEISVETASLQRQDYVFLDTRARNEYDVSHIDGASWVGYDDFLISSLDTLDKNSPIIVYCSVGYRSEKIAEKLSENGFSNVQNLYGGIFEWVNQKLPIVDSDQLSTFRIHAYDESWAIWLKHGEKVY